MLESERARRAQQRYWIIAPLLDETLKRSERSQLREALARENGISVSTLSTWLAAYKRDGFEGLKPKQRMTMTERTVDEDVLKKAIELRMEMPKRSVREIIALLEEQGTIEPGSVQHGPLQEALQRAGYSRRHMRRKNPVKGLALEEEKPAASRETTVAETPETLLQFLESAGLNTSNDFTDIMKLLTLLRETVAGYGDARRLKETRDDFSAGFAKRNAEAGIPLLQTIEEMEMYLPMSAKDAAKTARRVFETVRLEKSPESRLGRLLKGIEEDRCG